MSDFDEKMFLRFKELIYQSSGICFSDVNKVVLESRLSEIMRERKFPSLHAYYELVTQNEDELKKLLDAVTTNLTRFFRNIAHFDTLKNYAIPQILKYKETTGDKTFKFWSAGCSTGEECYSVAIYLKEFLPKDYKIKIVGSDISLTSLLTAQQGRYKKDKVKDVPPEYLEKYFTLDGDYYSVNNELKSLIQFDYHNLKYRPLLLNNDVVFCRNVLIYFDEAAQESVCNLIWETMAPFSFFFIGHSESLFGMNTSFTMKKTDWAFIYQKNIKGLNYD